MVARGSGGEPRAGSRTVGRGGEGVKLQTHAFKVLAPEPLVGALLSRGAVVKDDIQHATNARLTLSNRDEFYPGGTKLRVLIVHADEPQQVSRALERLVNFTKEQAEKEGEKGGKGGRDVFSGRRPGEIVFRVAVPQFMSDKLIGQNGVHLGFLEKETHVQAVPDREGYDEHLQMRLYGTPRTICGALDMILKAIAPRIAQEPLLSWMPVRQFPPACPKKVDAFAASALDFVAQGTGGAPPPRAGGIRDRDVGHPPPRRDRALGSRPRDRDLRPPEDVGPTARSDRDVQPSGNHTEPFAAVAPPAGQPQNGPRAVQHEASGGIPALEGLRVISSRFPTGGLDFEYSITCDLPGDQCGALIGRRGAYMEFVQRVTGATVELPEEDKLKSDGMRSLTIVGKLLQVYVAHMLMMKRFLEQDDTDAVEEQLLKKSLEDLSIAQAKPPAPAPPQPSHETPRDAVQHRELPRRPLSSQRERSRSRDDDHNRFPQTRSDEGSRHCGDGRDLQARSGVMHSRGHERSRSRGRVGSEEQKSSKGFAKGDKGLSGKSQSEKGKAGKGGKTGKASRSHKDEEDYSEERGEKNGIAATNGSASRSESRPPQQLSQTAAMKEKIRLLEEQLAAEQAAAEAEEAAADEDSDRYHAAPAAPKAKPRLVTALGRSDSSDGTSAASKSRTRETTPVVPARKSLPETAETHLADDGGGFVEQLLGHPQQGPHIDREVDMIVHTWSNTGGQRVRPIIDWEDAVQDGCLAPEVHDGLPSLGLMTPTTAQRYMLPAIFPMYMDVIVQAPPGSGKTFGFVLPLISRLIRDPPAARAHYPGTPAAKASPVVLIISATRELARQTGTHLRDVLSCAQSELAVLTLYSGETLAVQTKPLERYQFDIVCATPGRLLEVLGTSRLSLEHASSIVLDEADQLLLGSGQEGIDLAVSDVLSNRGLPAPEGGHRQTLLVSAAPPLGWLAQSVSSWLRPPVGVFALELWGQEQAASSIHASQNDNGEQGYDDPSIAHEDSWGSAEKIQRLVWVEGDGERISRIGDDVKRLIHECPAFLRKVVVFTASMAQATAVAGALSKFQLRSAPLHGRQQHGEMVQVVNEFHEGNTDVLVVTNLYKDVLNYSRVGAVVQIDLPNSIDIYSARIGSVSKALAYVSDKDMTLAPALADFLEATFQEVPEWLSSVASSWPDPGEGWEGT